jgi:hypothetical protein
VTQDPDATLPALYMTGRDFDLDPARSVGAGRFTVPTLATLKTACRQRHPAAISALRG